MFKSNFNHGCVLVIGGAKSGKSRISLDICNKQAGNKIFIATAQALDTEMKERIQRHREERGGDWVTIEEPIAIVDKIREYDSKGTIILLDCLTLWISNLFMEYGESYEPVYELVNVLNEQLKKLKGVTVIVSNEVGMGIVPENDLARRYRDIAGSLNQRIADTARKVLTVMVGIPLVLKDE